MNASVSASVENTTLNSRISRAGWKRFKYCLLGLKIILPLETTPLTSTFSTFEGELEKKMLIAFTALNNLLQNDDHSDLNRCIRFFKNAF